MNELIKTGKNMCFAAWESAAFCFQHAPLALCFADCGGAYLRNHSFRCVVHLEGTDKFIVSEWIYARGMVLFGNIYHRNHFSIGGGNDEPTHGKAVSGES